VLAGGAGLRLRPLTNNHPKPMVRVLGKPILQWVVEWLKSNGILNFVFGVAYRKESVIGYFKDGSELGVNIKYSVHSVSGETGEGFRLAINRHINDELFVAVNGDELTNFNLRKMIAYHSAHNPVATIAVAHPQSPFGIVNFDKEGLVSSFEEKPKLPSLFVNIGVYLLSNRITKYLPTTGAIERTAFPLLAKENLLRAFPIDGTWLTVNTMKDLEQAEKILKQKTEEGTWLECS
jgi:mannose-1-phosphate guanylyltransferase/phosphomannomutase